MLELEGIDENSEHSYANQTEKERWKIKKELIKLYFRDRNSIFENDAELLKMFLDISFAINKLPLEKQNFLFLRYVEKRLYVNISQKLNVSEVTVKRWNKAFKEKIMKEEQFDCKELLNGYGAIPKHVIEMEHAIKSFEVRGNLEARENCEQRKKQLQRFFDDVKFIFDQSLEKDKKIIEYKFKNVSSLDLTDKSVANLVNRSRGSVTHIKNNFKKKVLEYLICNGYGESKAFR